MTSREGRNPSPTSPGRRRGSQVCGGEISAESDAGVCLTGNVMFESLRTGKKFSEMQIFFQVFLPH